MAKKKQEDLSSYDAIKKAFIKRCEDLSHVRSLHDVIRDFAELVVRYDLPLAKQIGLTL